MNAIAKAVEPLRQSAIEAARASALQTVEKVRAELEAAGWDAHKAAPFPRSFGASRQAYATGKARYQLFRALTVGTSKFSRSPGSPEPVVMSDERIAHFIKSMEEAAAESYEAYVAKLTEKVGEVTEAKLIVEGTWSYSLLQVKTLAGEIQKWKTQMIINVSVLGKLFNQWPTRLVK